MRELALFAGAGGGILGGHLLGWRTVCAVEWADYPRKVLLARQRDGMLSRFPIWDDVQTFDGNPWRGRVDVVSGGFPCQDISSAGKGAGIDGARSGMWFHMARIVREVRPKFVFVENSPMLTSRGLGRVLGDLAAMGYDAEWGVLGAVDVGAPHRRDRIWIVAHVAGVDRDSRMAEPARQFGTAWAPNGGDDVADAGCGRLSEPGAREVQFQGRAEVVGASQDCVADRQRCEELNASAIPDRAGVVGGRCDADGDPAGSRLPNRAALEMGRSTPLSESERSDWWATEPALGRVAHGVADRVDRLKAIGNGQVPAVAATAFRILTERAGWTL